MIPIVDLKVERRSASFVVLLSFESNRARFGIIPPKLCAMKRMGRDCSWSLRFLASAFKRLFLQDLAHLLGSLGERTESQYLHHIHTSRF